MIPFPKMVPPSGQPQPPVCLCKQESRFAHFCEACNEYSDCCLACMPQPKCTCVYTDVDVVDAIDCELCDPDSHYNWLLAKAEKTAAARRKPAGREVAEPFRTIIENFLKGAR